VQDGLKKGGANIVFFDGITAGEKDFSALLARLKKRISTSFTTAATTRKWGRCCVRRAPSV
jgi:branched-chain amino acid transport system substrate-binding protein